MIASIRGEVLAAGSAWCVIDVGGVGMRVEVPTGTRAHLGERVSLHTSLVVREDALTLYGFESAEQLEVFSLLIGVTGVGPRSALGVLSELTPAQIARAAANEDEAPFRRAPGIGPKTAKLIVVQLGGKLDPRAFGEASALAGEGAGDTSGQLVARVEQGLIGLGYTETQATAAVEDAIAAGAADDESGLLRASLALLQRGGGR